MAFSGHEGEPELAGDAFVDQRSRRARVDEESKPLQTSDRAPDEEEVAFPAYVRPMKSCEADLTGPGTQV